MKLHFLLPIPIYYGPLRARLDDDGDVIVTIRSDELGQLVGLALTRADAVELRDALDKVLAEPAKEPT